MKNVKFTFSKRLHISGESPQNTDYVVALETGSLLNILFLKEFLDFNIERFILPWFDTDGIVRKQSEIPVPPAMEPMYRK